MEFHFIGMGQENVHVSVQIVLKCSEVRTDYSVGRICHAVCIRLIGTILATLASKNKKEETMKG